MNVKLNLLNISDIYGNYSYLYSHCVMLDYRSQ